MSKPLCVDEQIVTEADLEARLEEISRHVRDPRAGLFGPDSVIWRVGRESLTFLAGGRAALLQLAHPAVAHAIAQHSDVKSDPMARFRRTFVNVFGMVYGSQAQAFDRARKVHKIHQHIGGSYQPADPTKSKVTYQANTLSSLIWVHATLWDSSIKAYETTFAPLSPSDQAQYYEETKIFAGLFGIPQDALPETWDDFLEYNRAMWQGEILEVTDVGREIAHFLLKARLPMIPGLKPKVPIWYGKVTAGLLPPNLRNDFGLTFGPRDRADAERAVKHFARAYKLLPPLLRYIPPYQEAMGRLAGKEKPDLLVRQLNKIWVGEPSLVSQKLD